MKKWQAETFGRFNDVNELSFSPKLSKQ